MTHPLPDPVLTQLSDRDLFLVTLFGECRGCTAPEQQGVACSIRNRVGGSHWFSGATYRDVLLMWAQYDALWLQLGGPNYFTTLAFAKRLLRGDAYTLSPLEQRCASVVDACMSGPDILPDLTGGATDYYDDSIKPPAWAKPPAEESYVAGRLHFWRNVA